MKVIGLRQLVREPTQAKRWTRSGQSVRVTDNGEPLWIIQPDAGRTDAEERQSSIDELLEEALRAPRSQPELSQLVLKARR